MVQRLRNSSWVFTLMSAEYVQSPAGNTTMHVDRGQLQCAHPGDFSALVRMSHSVHSQCDEYSMHVAEPKQLDLKRIYHAGLFIHAQEEAIQFCLS